MMTSPPLMGAARTMRASWGGASSTAPSANVACTLAAPLRTTAYVTGAPSIAPNTPLPRTVRSGWPEPALTVKRVTARSFQSDTSSNEQQREEMVVALTEIPVAAWRRIGRADTQSPCTGLREPSVVDVTGCDVVVVEAAVAGRLPDRP